MMKKFTTYFMIFLMILGLSSNAQNMVITAVYDGPLTGGIPKGVEIYVISDIADASIYGLGSANNGGGSDGEEFTFPANSFTAGDFIYVASEAEGFNSFFGFDPDYTSGAMSINGDDAIELFMSGNVVDVFGDIDFDGTGEPWDYLDGWAYRVDGTGPDGSTFVLDNFIYSGINQLEGGTTNASTTAPVPIGTYEPGAFVPDPEPTNYPSDFTATVDVTNIDVTWTNDEAGAQLPLGYLVLAKYEWADDFTIPVDGVPVENDWNFTDDGYYANNIFGNNEENLFMFLDANTGYDFAIFPYTNSGEYIDYKTDGAYPEASGTTDNVYFSLYERFDPVKDDGMFSYSVTGDEVWEWANFGVPPGCMKMTGHVGSSDYTNEDWLITPALDVTYYSNLYFRFDQARNYGNIDQLFVMVSTDYAGGNPSIDGTWEDITDLFTFNTSGSWNFYDAGIGDVTDYISSTTSFAFKYTSTDASASTWEVDNIRVYSYVPIIDITDPNGGEIIYQGYPYTITWNYENWAEDELALYLYDDVTHNMILITESAPVATGSYTWNVWTTVAPGEDYMIFVESPGGTHDYSDEVFTIAASEELMADFEADTTIVAVGDSVMFTDMTTGIPAPTSWMWTFEGGTPATFDGEEPPYIVYNEAGVWDVTLEVSNGLMTDSLTMEEYIACGADLVAGFEADTTMVAVGDSVMFTDMSFGAVTSWLWTFEGGTPATFDGEEPPYIVYNEMGMWDVTLIVSDGEETDTLTMEEYIEVVNLLTAPINLVGEVGPFDDVQFTWGMPAPAGLQDDFESYDDFVLEFAPWTNVDVDGSNTYGMTGVDWPNSGAPQAFIIFNPSMTTPPVDDMTPHSGDKFAACLAAVPSPTNDDWMITPLTGIESDFTLAFWAKSYTDQYGLERFKVGVSTTGMDPADFTIISEGDYVEAPVEDWTEFTYDLSAYEGQNVYIGIQCVSNDAFVFMVDDVTIGATISSIVYNPSQPVVGNASKSVNYTSKPAPLPEVTAQTSRSTNDELMGFNVYRDDVKINSELVTANEYNDAEPPIGSHDYYVTAVYDVGESGPSNIVSIVVTDINYISETSVNVYPNPSNGTFTISLPEGVETILKVMDLTGKLVYQSNARGTTTINLDNMYKGIYLLNIYDTGNNTNIVKKLVIN